MWPFLFILALFPLFFYWSDSVQTLFPQLAHYFPDKDKPSVTQTVVYDGSSPALLATAGEPNRWHISESESGYLAWVVSGDGQYRLATGCHANSQPVLQLTSLHNAQFSPELQLNYQYGRIPLSNGTFWGDELIPAVAQFQNLYLQSDSGAVVAQFTVALPDSNLVARSIQQNCL